MTLTHHLEKDGVFWIEMIKKQKIPNNYFILIHPLCPFQFH